MIFPGHIAAGFLTTYSVVSFFPGLHAPVGGTELAALFAAGTLLGDAPDIDVLFYFLKKKDNQSRQAQCPPDLHHSRACGLAFVRTQYFLFEQCLRSRFFLVYPRSTRVAVSVESFLM